MAIAHQQTQSTIDDEVSSITYANFAVGSGADRSLVAIVYMREPTGEASVPSVSGIVFNTSEAFTKRASATLTYASTADVVVEVWTLDNPTNTTADVVATLSEVVSYGIALVVIEYTGANNGVGANVGSATGNSASPSVTFSTGAADSLIVGGINAASGSATFTPGANVTELRDITSDQLSAFAGEKAASGGSDTIDATISGSIRWSFAAIELLAASGGISQAVGQTTEANTAQVVNKAKAKAVGLNSETDTAQPVAQVKSLAIGQIAETDTVFAITAHKALAVGLAEETDTAQPITAQGAQVIPVGQASETEAAQAITASKALAVGLVSETDEAQSVAIVKTLAIGQAAETDTVQSVGNLKSQAVGIAVETDAAQPITPLGQQIVPIDQAGETDIALAITVHKTQPVGQAVEIDTAQTISLPGVQIVPVGQVVESDSVFSISSVKTLAIGQATETDSAQPIGGAKALAIGVVSETDISLGMLWSPKVRLVGIAIEADAAFAMSVVTVLPKGEVSISFDGRLPGVGFSVRQAGMAFVPRQSTVDIED